MNDFRFPIEHVYRPYPESVIRTENSVIYKAQDLDFQRDVCIKEVSIAGRTAGEKKKNLEKALSEARTMVKVTGKTESVPAIYLVFHDPDASKIFIVMDWINGRSLGEFIADTPGRVKEFEFITWMEELCSTLAVMSEPELKIYHKDIKPDNILIDTAHKLHLMDFNISVSLPNRIEGTPLYKAPEMETSKTVNRDKVDVFSIGVILYQYYSKKIPVKGREYGQRSILRDNDDWDIFIHPKENVPDMSEHMDRIITNCMQKDARKRYDIKQLLYEIRAYKREISRNGKKDKGPNKKRTAEARQQ